jgi:RNA polymerase sigma-70 factor (ECF subfamily)
MYLSDDTIIARVQAGDRQAYLYLFDRYYARVEGYARHQIRNAEAARDLASETFLRAYRSVDGFRTGEVAYLSYLLLICRRLIINERARHGKAPTTSWEEASLHGEPLADSAELPLDRMLKAEQRGVIQKALHLLSAEDREIILLAFEQDLSRRDIADVLGKPTVSAVTSHLYRAMQKLKAILVKQGYFSAAMDETERVRL